MRKSLSNTKSKFMKNQNRFRNRSRSKSKFRMITVLDKSRMKTKRI
jgi:hypothetical protein